MSLKPTISELRALGHHQTTYDWGIQFLSLPSLITNFSNSDLNTRCQSATLPSMTIEEISIDLRGHKAFQQGIGNYGNTLEITLYETIDSKVQEFLNAYMNMQWMTVTGVQTPKTLNQSSFLLTLLNSEHNATRYYTIIGAWLKGYSPSGNLQSSASDILTWNTTWQFDYFITNKA